MRADRVEVSWDAVQSNWLVRIQTGEEVILRHFKAPEDADEPSLRPLIQKTLRDEGYEPEAAQMQIRC